MKDFEKKMNEAAEKVRKRIGDFNDRYITEHAAELSKGINTDLLERWDKELNEYLDKQYTTERMNSDRSTKKEETIS